MFLSRSDALLLHKVLFHYEKITGYDQSPEEISSEILALSEKIADYLLATPGQGTSVCAQDGVDSGTKDSQEKDEEKDDEEDDDEDLVDAMPEATAMVAGALLHDLPPIETDHGDFEFEDESDDEEDDGSQVNLLVDGDFCGDDAVSLIKRAGKVIEVWLTTGEKFSFELRKLNKEWKKVFSDGLVYRVIDD